MTQIINFKGINGQPGQKMCLGARKLGVLPYVQSLFAYYCSGGSVPSFCGLLGLYTSQEGGTQPCEQETAKKVWTYSTSTFGPPAA